MSADRPRRRKPPGAGRKSPTPAWLWDPIPGQLALDDDLDVLDDPQGKPPTETDPDASAS